MFSIYSHIQFSKTNHITELVSDMSKPHIQSKDALLAYRLTHNKCIVEMHTF